VSGGGEEWIAVAAATDVVPGAALCADTGAGEVAVFNVDGDLVAVEARCLHKGGPLAEGMVSNGIVTCPLHWWRYDLRTGERLGAPDLRLTRYPVRISDGQIEILAPPPPPPPAAGASPASLRDRLLDAAHTWQPGHPPPPE
jgi:nitrite reductase/ring-hydroxylating ferredoxin subunit